MTEKTKEVLRQHKWIHNFKGFLPDKLNFSGVYMLSFPNGKWYVGSSINLGERLKSHLCNLNNQKVSTKWYSVAQEENMFPIYKYKNKLGNQMPWWELYKLNYLSIHYCRCEDYGEYEDQILKSIEDKNMWYNTQFYGNNKRGELNGIF